MTITPKLIIQEKIEGMILYIRGIKVILDTDLAALYNVRTKRLNEQVKRNIKRFPEDFMFQLTSKETHELVANCDRLRPLKHSTSNPYVFTEQGIAMLSSVLNSDKAIEINIQHQISFQNIKVFGTALTLSRRIWCSTDYHSSLKESQCRSCGHFLN